MRLVFSQEEIRGAVDRIAEAVNRDYEGREVLFLGILKGSFLFLADLIRRIRIPCTVEFVRLSSYGCGTSSTGTVEERMPRLDPVCGRHVIVVEDIVDSGLTLSCLLGRLQAERPASLEVCALVDKTGRRDVPVPVRYRGFVLEEGFLVGYGLDLDEKHRNLSAIYSLDDTP